jgi:6-phosphogluconolactonase
LKTPVSGDKSAAAIAIAPSGKFLYASVRGTSNIIATLSVDPSDGSLTLLTNNGVHGVKPRQFALDDTGQWLFVANEVTNNVSVFAVDIDTGALTFKSAVSVGNDPEFVTLLP